MHHSFLLKILFFMLFICDLSPTCRKQLFVNFNIIFVHIPILLVEIHRTIIVGVLQSFIYDCNKPMQKISL